MKRAIAELDAEQREALLYLADLGLAVSGATLVVGLVQMIIDLI